jgi:molybdenum ABC transporter molybdate-binding protein
MAWAALAQAGQATVAVATNFKIPAERLVALFQAQHSEHRIRLVSGSTGKLYTQIIHGAPFDIFMAADAERPLLLEERGLAVNGSRRTYALGQLALVAHAPADANTLRDGSIKSLAMANPKLAPYGLAAQQTLQHLQVQLPQSVKVVYAENVGQAYAMVISGNAQAAFVARSLLNSNADVWLIPDHYHEPIRQQLVLLRSASDNAAALAFLTFLESVDAAALIHSFGYLPAAS